MIESVQGNRSQFLQRASKGDPWQRICRAPHNPVYYMDENSLMLPINLGKVTPASLASVGSINLRDGNVVTAGIRADADTNKFLGLRRDFNQKLNTESLEFSIISVEFDGKAQVIDLSKNDMIGVSGTDLGSMIIQTARQFCRQMIPVKEVISGFRIEYLIHAKGLYVRYFEELDEYWFFSITNNGFRFRIREPFIVEADTFEPFYFGKFKQGKPKLKHSMKDNGDGTYTYIKESAEDFSKLKMPESYLIDVDTYYSQSSDGVCGYWQTGASNWSACRDAAASNGAGNTATTLYDCEHNYNGNAGYYYAIARDFFIFDTTATVNPAAVSFNMYVTKDVTGSNTMMMQKGLQHDVLEVGDYDAVYPNLNSGTYGNTAALTFAGGADLGWKSITFNATGIADINVDGNTKTCMRGMEHDYNNSAPPAVEYNYIYFRSADYANGTYDPYLSVTEGTPPAGQPTVKRFGGIPFCSPVSNVGRRIW